jgi:hypothetical protein
MAGEIVAGRKQVKAFIAAVVLAAILAIGASYLLSALQEPVSVAFATEGARVGDSSHHLIY